MVMYICSNAENCEEKDLCSHGSPHEYIDMGCNQRCLRKAAGSCIEIIPKKEFNPDEIKEVVVKCPHGHQFGVDCDYTNDCDRCECWHPCVKAYYKAEKEKGQVIKLDKIKEAEEIKVEESMVKVAENKKNPMGICRQIDDFGRITIPKDIRTALKIDGGDTLYMVINEEGVLLITPFWRGES